METSLREQADKYEVAVWMQLEGECGRQQVQDAFVAGAKWALGVAHTVTIPVPDGLIVETLCQVVEDINTANSRCEHDVDGTDCYECYPTDEDIK